MANSLLVHICILLTLSSADELDGFQYSRAEVAMINPGLNLDLTVADDAFEVDDESAFVKARFCWKDSYGRGVGTVPASCPRGYDRIGLLCYKSCPSGMERKGFDCHSKCPAGMADQGLFCRRAEYGRGAGYAWRPWSKGRMARCESDYGRGNCEWWGAMVYPKCKSGYYPVGCCICRPHTPNCGAMGLGGRFDLSCAKKIIVGNPITGTCGSKQKDGGLCYPQCRSGYYGVGPVCWSVPPAGWVNCGMGSAKSSSVCAKIIVNQITAVGQIAMFVASLGSSSALTSAANAAKNAGKLAKLKAQFDKLKRAYDKVKNLKEVKKAKEKLKQAQHMKKSVSISREAARATTVEDMVRVSAMIAAIVDPTGVSATVAAYTYPKCSKLTGVPAAVEQNTLKLRLNRLLKLQEMMENDD